MKRTKMHSLFADTKQHIDQNKKKTKKKFNKPLVI